MDSVVVEVEERLEAYEDAIEVSILGCAVNGIGEARHADFGITGAKDAGMIYSKGEPIRKVKTGELVDELFAEIDKYYAAGQQVIRDDAAAAEAREWLAENEDETAMTPERLARLEAQAAATESSGATDAEVVALPTIERAKLDETASPVAGRRFKRG
jgi:(E)-4-hydroxy-3-methylbut-2-enyl-diphosphate synthase